MEGFKDGREVLLSCTHIFHRHCLSSFEIFMKSEERSCPVCRAIRYQKKITRLGSKAYEAVCSLKIQRIFRGHLARKEYYNIIKIYYDSGRGGKSRQRTRFYEKQLSTFLGRIDDDFQRNKIESDSFLRFVNILVFAVQIHYIRLLPRTDKRPSCVASLIFSNYYIVLSYLSINKKNVIVFILLCKVINALIYLILS